MKVVYSTDDKNQDNVLYILFLIHMGGILNIAFHLICWILFPTIIYVFYETIG